MDHSRAEVEIAGTTTSLAYADSAGSGVAVVYLHGLGSDSSDFVLFENDDASRRYRLIAPDLPGHGGSRWTADEPVTVDLVAQLMSRFTSALELDRFHLIGHSLGGAIALRLAEQSPGSLLSLINIEGNLVPEDCTILSRSGANPVHRSNPGAYFEWLTRKLRENPSPGYREYSRRFRNTVCTEEAWFDYCKSLVELSDHGELLSRFCTLDLPRSYVHGSENDPRFLDQLRDSGITVREVDRSAHWPMYSNPSELATKLLSLVGEAPSRES